MKTFDFEAIDPQGKEFADFIEAESEEKAQSLISCMGYFITMINERKTDEEIAAEALENNVIDSLKTFYQRSLNTLYSFLSLGKQ